MRRLLAILWMIAAVTGSARLAGAQDYHFLGKGSLSHNDALLDGDDRWQTGGSSFSFVFGPEGTQTIPDAFGRVIELRLRGQVITPDNCDAPAACDRQAASVATATVHSHFFTQGFEVSAGAGLAATGPQIPLMKIQSLIHDLTPANEPPMSAAVRAGQIPNAIYPTLLGEAARRFQLGEGASVRPFVEVQAGVETYARVGADVFVGGAWDKGILARDGTTGFAYQTLKDTVPPGLSFTFGADAARVVSSALLPSPAYNLTPLRLRARAGLQYKRGRASVFGGVAWLGREFSAQPTGQAVTAVKLNWDF